jgi:AraC family transcriptional regulator
MVTPPYELLIAPAHATFAPMPSSPKCHPCSLRRDRIVSEREPDCLDTTASYTHIRIRNQGHAADRSGGFACRQQRAESISKDHRMSFVLRFAQPSPPLIAFSPAHIVRRKVAQWRGLRAEALQMTDRAPFEYAFRAPAHLLIAAERGERYEGETEIDGVLCSRLHEFSRKLSFIPAGSRFHGWQRPRVLTQVSFFYIDPEGPLLSPDLHFSRIEFKPRLYFFDKDLWATAAKLKNEVESPTDPLYAEALSVVLLHEIIRLNQDATSTGEVARGGLAAWQQKRVARFIEEHLAEPIVLATLADLVRLSPFHFARAFKQSFGIPPHRYHTTRRIDRGKTLLAGTSASVTEIALQVGFSETSSFTAAFRKLTGSSPTEYRRGLE